MIETSRWPLDESHLEDLRKEIGARIASVRGSEGQSEFAARMGVAAGTLGRYERGERFPDAEFVLAFTRLCAYPADWLYYGGTAGERGHRAIGARAREAREALKRSIDEMAAGAGIRRDLYQSIEEGAMPDAIALAGLASAGVDVAYLLTGRGSALREERASYDAKEFAMLPLYDIRAAAGRQRFLERKPAAAYRAYSREWLNRHVGVFEERLQLINVAGDSLEPRFHDGDELMADRGDVDDLREGYYAFCFRDQLLTKRLSLRANGFYMGRALDPSEYALDELHADPSFKVIARLIGRPTFEWL